MEKCLFPARVGIFFFIVNLIKILFRICTLTWCVTKYCFRQERGINRRSESTTIKIMYNSVQTVLNYIFHLIDLIGCYCLETIASLKKKLHFRCFQEFFWRYKITQSSPFFRKDDIFKKWAKVGSCVCRGKHKNFQGTASHRTHLFLESPRSV